MEASTSPVKQVTKPVPIIAYLAIFNKNNEPLTTRNYLKEHLEKVANQS